MTRNRLESSMVDMGQGDYLSSERVAWAGCILARWHRKVSKDDSD